MKKLLMAAIAMVALVGVSVQSNKAHAAGINGSINLINSGVTLNDGTNLGNTTSLSFSPFDGNHNLLTGSSKFGDYSTVPNGTQIQTSVLNLASLLSFTYSTFTANEMGTFNTVSVGNVIQQNANFLDVFLIGLFTPNASATTPLGGLDPTLTSLRISFNQSGDSVSGTITQNSPPANIPEPGTLALLGASLVGLGVFRRRRG